MKPRTIPKLVFMEGISGVGKSTMAQSIADTLTAAGYKTKLYLEGDTTNPIDFYATACFPQATFNALCATYPLQADRLREHAVPAGTFRLVRYQDGDSPLFPEPLLTELIRHEFCWQPENPVPVEDYLSILNGVRTNWLNTLNNTYDFILFDGALIHHPVNDMLRNYSLSREAIATYITDHTRIFDVIPHAVFYLKTNDPIAQLTASRKSRGQSALSKEKSAFWTERFQTDLAILEKTKDKIIVFDISGNQWHTAESQILHMLDE